MERLIKKAIKGDGDAFVLLMQQSESSLYKIAKAILNHEEDIGDAMQETILAAYKSLHTLQNLRYFKTWLTRILINKCNDIIKANQKVILLEHYTDQADQGSRTDKLEVDDCLASLSKEQQLVLNLYYHQGFNTREIGELLQESENTVKSRLNRARRYFKKIFLKSEQGGL